MPAQAAATDNTSLNSIIMGSIRKGEAQAADIEKKGKERQAQLEKDEAAIQAIKRPDPPQYSDFPKRPNVDYGNPLSVFKNYGVWLMILGSLATRRPLAAAANAAAAAMNGYKQGKLQQAEQAEQQWKDQMEVALKQNELQNQRYQQSLEAADFDYKTALQKLQADQAIYPDPMMAEAIRRGDASTAIQVLRFRQEAQAHLVDAMGKYESMKLRSDAFKDWQRKNPNATPEQKNDKWNELKNATSGGDNVLTGDALDYAAESYRKTGKMPSLGLGSSGAAGQNRSNIIKRATELAIGNLSGKSVSQGTLAADVSLADQLDVKSAGTALTNISRIASSAEAYENTALRNMEIVKSKMPKGEATNLGPWLDRWVQSGRSEFGDPDVPPYVTSLVTVANEYAKVMSGSTGAQGSTVDSRREAAELLNAAQTTDQVINVMDVMKQDMENKKSAYRDQASELRGRISEGDKPEKAQSGLYHIDQIITGPDGKRYRVVGGDMKDPDIVPADDE